MIGERQMTWRSITTKRLDSPSACRFKVTRANRRWEVELPMSIPTVRSSMVSCSQMARAIASRSASDISSCSCSSSKSCIRRRPACSRRRPDGLRRADDAGQRRRRQGQDRRLIENVAHLRGHAVVLDRLEPLAVDARILILVFDLTAALLHRDRTAAFGALAAERDKGIAPAAEAAGEIARRLAACVEVLVEHPERRRVHEAVAPGKFLELLITLVPQQRVALPIDRMNMGAGSMAVRLLVAACGDLRHMRVHRAVGEDEAHVHRSLAARFELVELEAREVVDEVRLPDVPSALAQAGRVGAVVAVAVEMLR